MKTKYISKNTITVMVFAVITLFNLSSCNTEDKEQNTSSEINTVNQESFVELTEDQYKMVNIKTGTIEQKNLSSVLKVNGSLGVPPKNLVSISAPLGGFVNNTELLQGMRIKKGDVLAVLEHPDYVQIQQDYIDKKSQLKFLEEEYKRQEELNKENVSSTKVFQQTQSNYVSMQAQVKGLEEKLAIIGINANQLTEKNISRKVNIYSPISGYVSEVNVNVGKYVNPSEVMFEIIDTEHLHVELTVYEKDIVKLKEGQSIRFTLPNDDNKERLASIYLIGRKIDAERSVNVHAHLEAEDTELLPGMYVSAVIELDENKVNAVPEEAIVMSDGKHFVYVQKGKEGNNHLFEMLEVKKGVSENGFTEISFVENTNAEKLQLVTNGAFALLSKMKNTEEE